MVSQAKPFTAELLLVIEVFSVLLLIKDGKFRYNKCVFLITNENLMSKQ